MDEQTPTLADRLEAEQGHPDGGDITLADLRAAAVRLRKLDRIEAALALDPRLLDCWTELVERPSDCRCPGCRLADALGEN